VTRKSLWFKTSWNLILVVSESKQGICSKPQTPAIVVPRQRLFAFQLFLLVGGSVGNWFLVSSVAVGFDLVGTSTVVSVCVGE